jgi:Na+/proline symporter
MKKVMIAAAATVCIIALISIALSLDEPHQASYIGLISFFGSVVCFFIGIVLIIIKQTRQVGKGVLIGCGVVLIIAFSICSQSQYY